VVAGCAAAGAAGEAAPAPPPGSGFHMMMAEIAAQRGVQATAAEEYLRAAEASEDPQLSRVAAEFAFEYGFDAWALRAARRWAQLEPAEPAAHLTVARLELRRNDVAAATAAVERALGPVATRSEEDYELLADELAAEPGAEAVTRVLTRVAAPAPESAALRLAIGSAALRAGDLDLALSAARAALAAGATDARAEEAHALVGRALLADGGEEEALAYMAGRARATPTPETGLEYATLLASAERDAEARAALDALEQRQGAQPGARRLRAALDLAAGDIEAAWKGYAGLLDDAEFADEARFYMAEIAMKQERYDQALQLLAGVGDGPYLLGAQDAISRIAEASGDPQSAEQLLVRLAERYPQRAFQAANYRAALLQRLGRDQEALDLMTASLAYRPDDADLLLTRGTLLERMGRLDEAIADMTAAVRIVPDNAVALNALGYTLANRTRRHDEAYRLIRRAIEREPESSAIMDSYGWALFHRGRLPEARSYLQYAWVQLPDPEVAAHLGEVMWEQGERDAARALWAEALEQNPTSAPLKDTMARFLD
jgi:tetratricopeptide (TPR) repeat protein